MVFKTEIYTDFGRLDLENGGLVDDDPEVIAVRQQRIRQALENSGVRNPDGIAGIVAVADSVRSPAEQQEQESPRPE